MTAPGESLAPNYLVDSHCHLDYGELAGDVEGVVNRAFEADVKLLLAINTRLAAFDALYDLIRPFKNVYCSVGVHPHEAEKEPDVELDALLEKAKFGKVIGIGETGLDYYYDHAPREMQRRNFRTHINAARQTGLPLIVHSREAEEDTMRLLEEGMEEGVFSGVIHCFTASREFARKALDLGLYISFSGILTFKNAKDIQETAGEIPLERILVETDAPYL
ncbi:MAG: TatD family hydrolase, partial [Sphingomonadales bacterium]